MRKTSRTWTVVALLLAGIGIVTPGAAATPPPGQGKPVTANAKTPIGDRILDDRKLFSAEFARMVRETPAGKGRIVPAPCPPIDKVKKKYGKPDSVKLETIQVEDGPTVMLALHCYGDLGLGVANELVMAVRINK